MARTKASPVTTLLTQVIWLGGPALSVAAGSNPLTHAHGVAAGACKAEAHPTEAGVCKLSLQVESELLVFAKATTIVLGCDAASPHRYFIHPVCMLPVLHGPLYTVAGLDVSVVIKHNIY